MGKRGGERGGREEEERGKRGGRRGRREGEERGRKRVGGGEGGRGWELLTIVATSSTPVS